MVARCSDVTCLFLTCPTRRQERISGRTLYHSGLLSSGTQWWYTPLRKLECKLLKLQGRGQRARSSPRLHQVLSQLPQWLNLSPSLPIKVSENAAVTLVSQRRQFMASIRKRGTRWQVQIRRKGEGLLSRSFPNRKAAETWARAIEAEADCKGLPPNRKVLNSLRLANLVMLPDPVLASRTISIPLVASTEAEKIRRSPARRSDWPFDIQEAIDELWLLAVANLNRVQQCDKEAATQSSLLGAAMISFAFRSQLDSGLRRTMV